MKPNEKEPMQLHYNVIYELNGKTETEQVYAPNPGTAMAITLKKFQDSKIIKAFVEGVSFGKGYQEWLAPPVQRTPQPEPRPARALKPNERGCEFSFYDEVRSVSPS
jgi:hypothetical protein